jgi:hypothetical protein
MPFLKLQFRPGINRDTTNYSNEGGWWECDKIRFFSGYPQKIGGWIEATSERFIGTCRQMKNWATSFSDNLLALGTNEKLYIEVGGYFYDITPLRATLTTPDTDDCVETTSGSPVATFAVTAHGCLTGDYVTVSGVTGDVGGIPDAELNAEHVVTKVDDDNFTVTVATSATSTVAGGGGAAIDIECQIHPGFPATTLGYGWGTGTYSGTSTLGLPPFGWGLASPQPIDLPGQDWFLDNFDNDLIANIRVRISGGGAPIGGPIYIWERGSTVNPITSLETRAVLLSSLAGAADVPESAFQILVSQNDKHLLAFGCQPYNGASDDFDPLLIRWASQDEPQKWEPLPTNSAGFLRVSRGSNIRRAIATRQEIVVLTDSSVYSLQFTGTTDVFALQELSDNTSLISPRAVTTASNTVFWMGEDKFYVYDGRVQTLPTTLREYVFKDINYAQSDQIISGTNEGFNEIWWFYPSENSTWNNRYVIYNYLDQNWYFGTMERTAWLDTPLRTVPVAVTTGENNQNNGILYNHESGIDDAGIPMESYIQSADFDIGDGEQFMLTRRIITDINFNQSNVTGTTPQVNITVRPRNFPGSQYQNDPSDTQNVIETTADIFTNQIFVRARARQMAIKVASNQLGTQWQLGTLRLDARQDGKR